MQREREEGMDSSFSRDFGGGPRESMMSSRFAVRDPFDDPFFTRPFGSMFQSPLFGSNATDKPKNGGEKGIVIQEICSDDDEEDGDLRDERKGKNQNNSSSIEEPSIEHPDDPGDDCQILAHRDSGDDNFKRVKGKANRSSVHTCKVTYGGIDGAYYTSTRTRRMDNEGVLLEEMKEADKTTGQATHRICRGIHDKGHSVTRKLNSDGKVDTLQTLHNLREDELAGFDKVWKGSRSNNNAMTSWDEGWAFPSFAARRYDDHDGNEKSHSGRTKKVVRINIE